MKKFLSIAVTAGLAMASLIGLSVPAQASGLTVTFPSSAAAFTANTWQSVATVTSTTPAITGTTQGTIRVTVSAGNSGLLRIDTTGVTAAVGYNLTNFNISSAGASTISFTGTVAQTNTALATLQFKKVAIGGSTITVRVSEGAGVVLGDHYYEVYSATGLNWAAALRAASSKKLPSSVQGANYECQGYLVSIETAQEQALVFDAVRASSWMGGSDDFAYVNAALDNNPPTYANQAASEGKWHWVVGPNRGMQFMDSNSAVTSGRYANWGGVQPDNFGAGGEHYSQITDGAGGVWNDLDSTFTGVTSYVVEYGGLRTTASFTNVANDVTYTDLAEMGDVGSCVPAVVTQGVEASFTALTAPLVYDVAQADLDFDQAEQKLGAAALSSLLTQTGGGTDDIGEAIAVGDYANYYDVITIGGVQIDARVKITAQSGMESANNLNDGKLDKLDDNTTTTPAENRWIRSDATYSTGLGDQYVEYEIEFYVDLAGTPVPVTLLNVLLSTYDIDSYQYLEATNFDRYFFGTGSILSATSPRNGVTRFAETAGTSSSSSNMNSRVMLEFDDVSSLTVRLGQNVPGTSPEPSASYYLDFSLGANWGGAQLPAATPPVAGASVSVPYDGPVLGTFSDRTLDPCTPKSITITGTKLSGAAGSIQGKAVTILENTDTKLVIATPAGLTPARGVDLVITSPYGTLTHQNAFDIPAGVCSQTLSKGRWTQIQSDGKTVKMYAKDPIGDGKVQFFVDGKELAWVNAVDATDPKLSFASSFPYLVRSVDLKPGKNRFEIRVDGKRVWRTTYVPRS